MKKLIFFVILTMSLVACSSRRQAHTGGEQVVEIAGTWFLDGNKELPCYIVQNGRDLVFLSGKETSNGHFKSSMEVFAKDWNRNAILSADLQTLKWADRSWVKGTFQYPEISGTWYENGDPNKQVTITQSGTKLVMDNGTQKLNGYFYTTNAIYSLENNNYATYSPATNTISWGQKVWMRKVKS